MLVKNPILKVFVKDGQQLFLASTFTYDVSLYKCERTKYNLEDSRTITSKTFVKDSLEYYTKDNMHYKKVVTLQGAPEVWLLKNKYQEKNE
jgi:hypothetical protein